jgi:glutamate:GABA antiporter
VKGAYDVLVSLGIITYLLPYLFLFAAMFRLQSEAAGPQVIRVPGGKPVARLLAIVGFTTSLLAVVLSLFPAPGETNPTLAVMKVVGGTLLLIVIGGVLYLSGKKRAAQNYKSHLLFSLQQRVAGSLQAYFVSHPCIRTRLLSAVLQRNV